MLAKRIIPCLDVKDGRTVKGVNFVNLVDAGDPVELASRYCEEGADELLFLDITASHENRKTLIDMVKKVARVVNIPFTVGGGVAGLDHAFDLLNAGADKVSINTSAVRNPALIGEIAQRYGSQCVVLAIDARMNVQGYWDVVINGGRIPVGKDLFEWAYEGQERGAGEILFTSMNHDGTQNGFANEALSLLSSKLKIPVIASGGAGSMQHFYEAFQLGKADAALAASVFHYNRIPINDLKEYLKRCSISIR
jgi:cyclase